jgi:hypothetical protein
MVILAIAFRKKELLTNRKGVIALGIAFAACLSYYALREFLTPGYIRLVWLSEFKRIGSEVMSWHIHPFGFYYHNLVNDHFKPYIHILPFTLISFALLPPREIRIFTTLLTTTLFYFLLISWPAVKLEWYDAPLFPLLSVLIAMFVIRAGSALVTKTRLTQRNTENELLLMIIASVFLVQPYIKIMEQISWPEQQIYELELEGAYLKRLQTHHPRIDSVTVLKKVKDPELNDQVLFYKRAFELNHEMNIRITQVLDFGSNELVMSFRKEDQELIERNFQCKKVDNWNEGVLFRIEGK